MQQTVYDAMGGQRAVTALAEAWHHRVMADPVVSHAFHAGVHEHHTDRLAAYFAEQLGGPTTFTDSLGDYSSVVRMHTGNGPHEQMDGRAVAAFVRALDDADIPTDPDLRSALIAWFTWGTALLNHRWESPDEVPDDLPLPAWGWDGTAEGY
jgi:truncated hemoglobin YjbI